MKVETRVKLLFFLFTVTVTCIVSGVGLYYIKESIDLFANSPNKDLAALMAHRLFFKSFVSFAGLAILISGTALVIGSILFKKISGSFLKSVADITGLAEKRVGRGRESQVLQEYLTLLIEDQQRLNHYDKVVAWKDGARLLIHEVKNPLTPLKLSLQNIAMTCEDEEICEEINSSLDSVQDIENILGNFKELVNIEYGETYRFNFANFWNSLKQQLNYSHPTLQVVEDIENSEYFVNSEENLLKMLIINLIQNGIEANESGFSIHIQTTDNKVEIEAITEDRTISDIDKIFHFGVSRKGDKRGYGLFLCQKISDYLNLNLKAQNETDRVLFTFSIMRSR